jgi:hypothetical protein
MVECTAMEVLCGRGGIGIEESIGTSSDTMLEIELGLIGSR